jgi:hypothetical protein
LKKIKAGKKMNDFSKETLEKIKKDKLHPRPRWYFLTRNYFFWLLFVLTTLLGGIAFGMILFITTNLDWDIYQYLGLSLPKAIMISLPYLWIALMIFFLFVTYYNFIHTRKGYRYRFIFIFLISLLVSVLLGICFYHYGWTETVERQLRTRIPGYQRMVYTSEKQWMQPEKGLLSGTIIEINPDKSSLQLRDYHGKEWIININNAMIRGNISLEENMELRIIGQKVAENVFTATEIRTRMRGYQQGKGRRQ